MNERNVATQLRLFLLFEVILFDAAGLAHFGDIAWGHQHDRAALREGLVYLVLLGSLVATFVRRGWTPVLALFGQEFALVATLIAVADAGTGGGPRGAIDLVCVAAQMAILVPGLRMAVRARLAAGTGGPHTVASSDTAVVSREFGMPAPWRHRRAPLVSGADRAVGRHAITVSRAPAPRVSEVARTRRRAVRPGTVEAPLTRSGSTT